MITSLFTYARTAMKLFLLVQSHFALVIKRYLLKQTVKACILLSVESMTVRARIILLNTAIYSTLCNKVL